MSLRKPERVYFAAGIAGTLSWMGYWAWSRSRNKAKRRPEDARGIASRSEGVERRPAGAEREATSLRRVREVFERARLREAVRRLQKPGRKASAR